MSGREQGRRRKDARVYSTYDALVCAQFFEKRRKEEEEQIEGKRRRPKTRIHTSSNYHLLFASYISNFKKEKKCAI
jgi:hypothetical protein